MNPFYTFPTTSTTDFVMDPTYSWTPYRQWGPSTYPNIPTATPYYPMPYAPVPSNAPFYPWYPMAPMAPMRPYYYPTFPNAQVPMTSWNAPMPYRAPTLAAQGLLVPATSMPAPTFPDFGSWAPAPPPPTVSAPPPPTPSAPPPPTPSTPPPPTPSASPPPPTAPAKTSIHSRQCSNCSSTAKCHWKTFKSRKLMLCDPCFVGKMKEKKKKLKEARKRVELKKEIKIELDV